MTPWLSAAAARIDAEEALEAYKTALFDGAARAE